MCQITCSCFSSHHALYSCSICNMKRNTHFIVADNDFKLVKVSQLGTASLHVYSSNVTHRTYTYMFLVLCCGFSLVGRRLADVLHIQQPPGQAHVLLRVRCAEFLHSTLQPRWQGSHNPLPGPGHCAVHYRHHLQWTQLGKVLGGGPFN